MLENHAKLMALFEQAGEVVGRKRLQKMVYILKKSGVDFSERFSFHFYGPFSEELSTRIEELSDLGFLAEHKEQEKGYHQYRYRLTDEGASFLKQTETKIPDVSKWIEEMNGESSRFLELVSTMLYFDNFSKEEIEQKVHTVKSAQNFTRGEIGEAWEFINRMKKQQH